VPKLKLSDVGVQNLKPSATHTDFWDSALPSFGVRVAPSGTKTFVLKIHNARRAIGRYPIISLSNARIEAKRMLAEKTLGRVRPQSIAYPQAVALFIEDKQRNKKASTAKEYGRVLNKFPFRGQLSEITHKDTARQLGTIKDPSAYDHALVYSRIFFNWCVKRRYITENPTLGLSTHAKVKRARVLTDDEIKSLWSATDEPTHFNRIVRLLLLTGQRRGEIAGLRKEWICDDFVTLPAEITKNGCVHSFPIGMLCASVLAEPLKNSHSLLFPSIKKDGKPFNGWSKAKMTLDEASGVSDWTLHDLRRTFASNLGALGVRLEVIEKLLNHVSGSFAGVAGIYQRYDFFSEMRAAMELWDKRLTTILQPTASLPFG
jgi:integrase